MIARKETGRTRSPAAVVAALALTLTFFVALAAPAVPASASAGADPAGERTTVARLVSAAVKLSPTLARQEVGLQMVPRGSVLTDAGRLRPAADLGPWARSAGYRRVSPELGDALAEGSAPDATTRDWTRCYERGNGAAVVCPDGYVEVN